MSAHPGERHMRIVLSATGQDRFAGLESLNEWLRQEEELRGRVDWEHGEPDPTHLGDLSSALAVAVGSGGALTALAASLRGWLSQPRRPSVKLHFHGPDGRDIEIDAQVGEKHIPDLLALLRESLGEASPGEEPHEDRNSAE